MKNLLVVSCLVSALVVVGCNRSESKPLTSSASAALSNVPAPSTAELPPGHPPIKESSSSELPAGHPPIGGSSQPALPAGHPPLDMAGQSLPSETLSKSGNPQWVVPGDWKAGRTSSVRRGSFAVTGADGQSVDIAVTVFPGDVGGPLANVNRWRGQIGLAPVQDVAPLTTHVEANGLKISVVDFTSDQPLEGKTHKARMLVATIPHGGNSWFIKMVGDEPLVAAQKDAFLAFVKSVKF